VILDRSCSLFAALVATLLVAANACSDGRRTDWHAAATPVERALDAILKKVDSDVDDRSAPNFLGKGPPALGKIAGYQGILTQRLIDAILREEARLVELGCGGKYNGDVCGLGFLPIECAQDWSDTYLYHTEMANRSTARIASTWPSHTDMTTATYRLVRVSGRWEIDGISCGSGPAFNME